MNKLDEKEFDEKFTLAVVYKKGDAKIIDFDYMAEELKAIKSFIIQHYVSKRELVVITEAFEKLLDTHVELVDGGDCGYWDANTETEVINARAALSTLKFKLP